MQLSAGELDVDPTKVFVTLGVCRLPRFGLETLFAVFYRNGTLAWLDSMPFTASSVSSVIVGNQTHTAPPTPIRSGRYGS
jgi:hypothetical protein